MVLQDKVKLEESTHVYYDEHGCFFDSVSRVIATFCNKFDAMTMSIKSAKKKLKGTEWENNEKVILKTAEKLRDEWKKTGEDSSSYGTIIHKSLEDYVQGKDLDPRVGFMKQFMRDSVYGYDKLYCEAVVFTEKYGIAGTIDLLKVKDGVADIDDYKTNKEIDMKSKYGNKMKFPFGVYDDCSYFKYVFQQNIYMWILVNEFGLKPGKIRLINIPRGKEELNVIEIPLMLVEAERMMQYYVDGKSNSEENSSSNMFSDFWS